MDQALSPEVVERIRVNSGNFLLVLKTVLVCLLMVRFYKLGRMVNARGVAAGGAKAKGKASVAAARKPEPEAANASASKRRAKAA